MEKKFRIYILLNDYGLDYESIFKLILIILVYVYKIIIYADINFL